MVGLSIPHDIFAHVSHEAEDRVLKIKPVFCCVALPSMVFFPAEE